MSAADDKRYVLENGIDCVALGHYRLRDKWHFNWLSTFLPWKQQYKDKQDNMFGYMFY